MQAIVIVSWSGGQGWTEHCLSGLQPIHKYTEYPVIVAINDYLNADKAWVKSLKKEYEIYPIERDAYEMGVIKGIYEDYPEIEEFWTIQATVFIKTPLFILESFVKWKDIPVSYSIDYPYECYLGKWIRSGLDKIEIPESHSKKDAMLWEWKFPMTFLAQFETFIGIDNTWHTQSPRNYLGTIMGQERFVQEGSQVIKYKSVTDESGNIPDWWGDRERDSFFNSWRENERRLHRRNV